MAENPAPGSSDILGPEPGDSDILGHETGDTDELGPETGDTDVLRLPGYLARLCLRPSRLAVLRA